MMTLKNRYNGIFLSLLLIFSRGCGDKPAGGLSALPRTLTPDYSTPVIFVHGLSGIGGDTFYNFHEKFESYGFPENKMAILLLPRINAGPGDENYAWYAPVSLFGYMESHWKGNYVNADALKEAIDRLAPREPVKVNLVGHSNGTAVILKLLAKYPSYSARIKKIIFISGFCDVSGADGRDNILTDLNHCMPFKNLPCNIEYYSISSESDANINITETVYGKPVNDNPEPFGNTVRYWHMEESEGMKVINRNIPGMDHQGIVTAEESIAQVFEWLTGAPPPGAPVMSVVEIGGRIVSASGYSQQAVQSGSVELEYYDPSTGDVTGSAGHSPLTPDGRYSVSSVSTAKYLKMTVRANGGINVYFFADRIRNNSRALDFNAPEYLGDDNMDGMISVTVICRYSFLSSAAYLKRKPDRFSGVIKAVGCKEIALDSSCITATRPGSYLSMVLKNYGPTDAVTGTGNNFNFDRERRNNYASKSVHVAVDLQDAGEKTVIRINGTDRSNNIKNHIVYLYRRKAH